MIPMFNTTLRLPFTSIMRTRTRTLYTVLENILPWKCTIDKPERGIDLLKKKKKNTYVELARIQL